MRVQPLNWGFESKTTYVEGLLLIMVKLRKNKNKNYTWNLTWNWLEICSEMVQIDQNTLQHQPGYLIQALNHAILPYFSFLKHKIWIKLTKVENCCLKKLKKCSFVMLGIWEIWNARLSDPFTRNKIFKPMEWS